MSTLSARRQQHPSAEHVPVSIIAVNSSPPPLPPSPTLRLPAGYSAVRGPGPTADRPRQSTAPGSRWASWNKRPQPSVDVWTATRSDGSMRRSTSAHDVDAFQTRSSMPQSPQYGSAHHLGSSVTFCNAAAAAATGQCSETTWGDSVVILFIIVTAPCWRYIRPMFTAA